MKVHGYGLHTEEERNNILKLKLKLSMFEGMTVRYPMGKNGDKMLCWTIEHHARKSKGGYEVLKNGERKAVFHFLEDAIEYYNSI